MPLYCSTVLQSLGTQRMLTNLDLSLATNLRLDSIVALLFCGFASKILAGNLSCKAPTRLEEAAMSRSKVVCPSGGFG